MTVNPSRWPEAETYFRNYATGRYDKFEQLGYIYKLDEIRESTDGERLYIGRAGAGGIEFFYRKGASDIWAYYPIDGDVEWKADSIDAFEQGWKAGTIKV